jgi:hypothetical protein
VKSPNDFNFSKITIFDESDTSTDQPPGIKEVQWLYIDYRDSRVNREGTIDSSENFTKDALFRVSFEGKSDRSMCMFVNVSNDDFNTELYKLLDKLDDNDDTNDSSRGAHVSDDARDRVYARGGRVFRIQYFDEDNIPQLQIERCDDNEYALRNVPYVPYYWNVTEETRVNGSLFGMTVAQAGVVHGVVQRGNFTKFEVGGEPAINDLPWNANISAVKNFIEFQGGNTQVPKHRVDIIRDVIGKYGQIQYTIQFVFNEGNTPPGSGDINMLVVIQAAATNGQVYPPTIAETQRGSKPIAGNYKIDLHSPDGPRLVTFNEPPERLKYKLEELLTVGSVRVTRSNYPSSTTGGWGDAAVAANSRGGFEYQIHFLRNPGVYNGFSFPPGSGNIEPLTIEFTPSTSVSDLD